VLSAKQLDSVKARYAEKTARSRSILNLWVLLIGFLLLATCFEAVIVFHSFSLIDSKFDALANFECEAAVSAYQSGGLQQLESVMQRHQDESGVRAWLFEKNGHNVSGGIDRSTLLTAKPPFFRLLSRIQGRPSERDARLVLQNGKYSCIVTTDIRDRGFYGGQVVRFLALLSILCYGSAGYVAFRMRRLEAAIKSFGAGKLEVRLRSGSKDPIWGLSQAFNQMAGQVESLIDAQTRLCIDISHELRSPLTRLRLAIGLARSDTKGALEQIELESVRLNELVDQLLDVARAEVDPAALRRESIDMESLLTEVVDGCTIEANERSCEVDLRFDHPGSVLGDSELLRRAIENPVRNAIRHSPVGSRVEVACNGNADFAVISIRDQGPGVPDTALQEIFRPFYRVEPDRDRGTGGRGLGLAIVERAVALHQGSVKAENSTPGLRVEIRLPRRYQ
jgi:signal transduction histidine kinase